jgi:hypothetical protein
LFFFLNYALFYFIRAAPMKAYFLLDCFNFTVSQNLPAQGCDAELQW